MTVSIAPLLPALTRARSLWRWWGVKRGSEQGHVLAGESPGQPDLAGGTPAHSRGQS